MAGLGIRELKARLKEIQDELFPEEPGAEAPEPGSLDFRQLTQEKARLMDDLKRQLTVEAYVDIVVEMEMREKKRRQERSRKKRKGKCNVMKRGGMINPVFGKNRNTRKIN